MKNKPYSWISNDALFCRVCRRMEPFFNAIAILAVITLILLVLHSS